MIAHLRLAAMTVGFVLGVRGTRNMAQYLRLDQTASDLAKLFGSNCRKRRQELNLSQAELSERTGLAASHLSYIENGKANPTLEVMEALASGLGCSLVAMLSEAKDVRTE